MDTRALRSDGILLLTALIWGFAFTAQRVGMDHIGPFTYSGLRFILGALVLLPFYRANIRRFGPVRCRSLVIPGLIAGLFLTLGVSFQQVGLVYTSAGKAGFITGLYVVFVPVFGIVVGRRTHAGGWLGAALAVIGLYLLSVTGVISMARGDLLVLAGAVFWAVHVLVLARLAPEVPFVPLAIFQYLVCASATLLIAACTESWSFDAIVDATVPILYGGAISVGIAYTLQIVGQREAPPTHAAIILSLEGVFAAFGGALLLSETLAPREIVGCLFMLLGMLVSQLTVRRRVLA